MQLNFKGYLSLKCLLNCLLLKGETAATKKWFGSFLKALESLIYMKIIKGVICKYNDKIFQTVFDMLHNYVHCI